MKTLGTWACAAALALSSCESATVKDADAGAGASDDLATTPVKSTHKIYVFDTIGFTRLDANGFAPGFNLDHKVSDASDDGTCDQADFTAPDGTPGIDNQFATLVPLIEATGISAVETLLQASIETGGILLLFELDGLDDLVNDPQVSVRVRAAFGTPLLGTNGKLLTDQTFHVSPRDPDVNGGNAVIKDGWLTAGPFDINLPVEVFGIDYTLEARGTLVKFHIVDDERIDHGILGAGITISSIMALAEKAAAGQGDILPIVTSLVNGKGDLAKNATTGACDQMSAALQFTGVAAFFFPADVTATGG